VQKREVLKMKHKRILSALTGIVMAASMSTGFLTATAEGDAPYPEGIYAEPVLGDCNGDYMFGIADLVTLNNYLLGKTDQILFENADLNHDGDLNIFDLILMRRLFVDTAPLSQLYQVKALCDGIEPEEVTGADIDEKFALAQTGFGLELLKRAGSAENVLISPYSVMEALAMTANGAKGQTLKEMEEVLGGFSIDKLNEYLYTQRTKQTNSEKCKLLTANSIWARDDANRIKVNKDFLQTTSDYYDSEYYLADFDSPQTVDAINGWISQHTDKMIKSIMDEMNPDAVMELINAVTFDAKWEDEYTEDDIVKECRFTAADGREQTADMLCSTEYIYLEDENAKGFMKSYYGGRYAFAALLPDEDISLDEYIAQLTPEKLNKLLSEPQYYPVGTRIPKFSYDYSQKLEDVLAAMGMPTAIDCGTEKADFSAMNDADTYIYIGSVLHKTFIQLDENGTKAAAVTVVEMDNSVAPMSDKEIILDRPFLYCIVDMATNIPIFIGTLTSVE
jgi:serpin B